MKTFLLGTHMPSWLADGRAPLFVCDVRLRDRKTLPVAAADWACDSGGFSQLQQHGRWTVPPAEYVARLRRYRDEIGRLTWAAPQDWMCEPIIISGGRVGPLRFVGTGLSVAEHQRRTVANYRQLRDLAPDLPIIPVLQGWERDDYLRCIELYDRAGVDLAAAPLVGVGTVCRRQHTGAAGEILAAIRAAGVPRLHGFGFKVAGLLAHRHLLTSADSLAWSYDGRRLPHTLRGRGGRGPHTACGTVHPSRLGRPPARTCANCPTYAYQWRDRLVRRVAGRPVQPALF